jgi:hypothetical protein
LLAMRTIMHEDHAQRKARLSLNYAGTANLGPNRIGPRPFNHRVLMEADQPSS